MSIYLKVNLQIKYIFQEDVNNVSILIHSKASTINDGEINKGLAKILHIFMSKTVPIDLAADFNKCRLLILQVKSVFKNEMDIKILCGI